MGLVIPDETLTLAGGAVKPWQGSGASAQCQKDMMRFAKRDHIRTNVAWKDLTAAERDWVINGEPDWNGNWEKNWYGIKAFFAFLESKAYKMHVRVMLSRFRSYNLCPSCKGARLKPEGLFWRLGTKEAADTALGLDNPNPNSKGRYQRFVPNGMGALCAQHINELPGLTLPDLMQLPIVRLKGFFETLAATARDEASALVIEEILTRLNYLIDVGVGYLTLGRQSRTLSGGEVQRVNLTTALGTNLVDTLFVLRRALGGAASARHGPCQRRHEKVEGRRQHPRRRRARPAGDACGRPHHRHGNRAPGPRAAASSTTARFQRSVRRTPSRGFT